jgi:hypothetical protein
MRAAIPAIGESRKAARISSVDARREKAMPGVTAGHYSAYELVPARNLITRGDYSPDPLVSYTQDPSSG